MKRLNITGTGLLRAADAGLFLSYVGAVIAVYILDMIFFGSLVPLGWLTIVFILIGLVFRTVAVWAGVVLQKLKHHKDIKMARAVIRGLWLLCVTACLLSAINFFAAGHADKGIDAIMGQEIAQTQIESKASRIATINDQIAGIRTDRDLAIAQARSSIDAIKDEVDGMSTADNESVRKLQDDISAYQAQARADILEKENQIAVIESAQATVAVEQTVSENTADTWQVFIWLGDHMPFGGSDGWSTWGLFYLAMLLEAIAAFGLGAYADIRHKFDKIIASHAIDEDVRAIHHEAELTSARIRAEALKRKLGREAESEARKLMEDDPDLVASLAGIAFLKDVMGAPNAMTEPERETPPETLPPQEPEAEASEKTEEGLPTGMTREEFRLWKSQQAKAFYSDNKDGLRVPVNDFLTTDIEVAAE
jgi:hypothetical protein